MVYWWKAAKETQMIIFWVMLPLCVISLFTIIFMKYGKYGLLSSFFMCISVIWAIVGASITSHKCLK